MLNPSEPNTTRKIVLTFTTDAAGEMDIDIAGAGFESHPESVGLFLAAAVAVVVGDALPGPAAGG